MQYFVLNLIFVEKIKIKMKDIEFHNSKTLDETATLRYYVSTTRKCAERSAKSRAGKDEQFWKD